MHHFIVVLEQLIQLQLAQQVEEGEEDYITDLEGAVTNDHLSVVILNGLWLEDDQYVSFHLDLYYDFDGCWLGADLQRISRAMLVECSNHLCHWIMNWIELQEWCMPEAHMTQQQDVKAKPDGIAPHKPHDIPLHLPSSYKFWMSLQQPDLWEYELQLQEGWAHNALYEMCQHLCICTHLFQRKDKYL